MRIQAAAAGEFIEAGLFLAVDFLPVDGASLGLESLQHFHLPVGVKVLGPAALHQFAGGGQFFIGGRLGRALVTIGGQRLGLVRRGKTTLPSGLQGGLEHEHA